MCAVIVLFVNLLAYLCVSASKIAGEEFYDSIKVNDEILQEYHAKIRDKEDYMILGNTNRTQNNIKLNATKKSKSKSIVELEESQIISRDSNANLAINVISCRCEREY